MISRSAGLVVIASLLLGVVFTANAQVTVSFQGTIANSNSSWWIPGQTFEGGFTSGTVDTSPGPFFGTYQIQDLSFSAGSFSYQGGFTSSFGLSNNSGSGDVISFGWHIGSSAHTVGGASFSIMLVDPDALALSSDTLSQSWPSFGAFPIRDVLFQGFQLNADGTTTTEFAAARLTAFDIQGVTAPIPEPETYAMLIAGLALLGFHASRRKKRYSVSP